MKPQVFEEAIDVITKQLKEVLVRKQRQYGHGNILAFGKLGVMVRLSDKINRIINLWKTNHEPEDESLVDSYVDIANYAILWLMLHYKIFELPLKEDEGKTTPQTQFA